jgi:uncharacterized protein YecT (DUF1311 family)
MQPQPTETQSSSPAEDVEKLSASIAALDASANRAYAELAEKTEHHKRAALLAEANPDLAATRDRLKAEIDGIRSRIDDLMAGRSYGAELLKEAQLRVLDARKAADWLEVERLFSERLGAAEELLLCARKLGQHYARMGELAERIRRLATPHLTPGQYDRARLSDITLDDLVRFEIKRAGGTFVSINDHKITDGRFGDVSGYVNAQQLKLAAVSPLKGE